MKQVMEIGGVIYWAPPAVCEWADIHPQTFYSWVRRGLMPPPIKIGNRRYYPKDEVERRLSRGQ
jgi:DNA-binding transcriptional MerR regulator